MATCCTILGISEKPAFTQPHPIQELGPLLAQRRNNKLMAKMDH